jgi:purine-nucleoside phosphorylase
MTYTADGLWERAEAAAEAIRAAIGDVPRIAVVLGSGLGPLVDRQENRVVIPYQAIPHFPVPTVAGHHGNLVAGTIRGVSVLCLQGRFHYYEGHDLPVVTFPVRVLSRLGVKILILTAATGGLNSSLRPGDIMTLSDHLNLIGENPLRGPNDERMGSRFPDMTTVYSPRLRVLATEAATALSISLHEGIYACLPGPSYETPAEIRMLRTLGADVVGMSTVPEAIVARHSGIEVLAFALVTNPAAGVTGEPITHEEVLAAGRDAVPRLGGLIEAVVVKIGEE